MQQVIHLLDSYIIQESKKGGGIDLEPLVAGWKKEEFEPVATSLPFSLKQIKPQSGGSLVKMIAFVMDFGESE